MKEPFWTDDKIAEMRRLAAEGHSSSQMGAVLGCSRNAVIGKMHRLKFEFGFRPKATPRAKPAPSLAGDTGGYRMPKVRLRYQPRKAPEIKTGKICGIVDVTGCRWAVDFDEKVPGGHLFCNAEIHDHRYCEFHAHMSGASYSDELIRRKTKAAIHAYTKRVA